MFKSSQQKKMFQPIVTAIKSSFPEFADSKINKLPKSSILNKAFSYINVNGKTLQFVAQDQALKYPELGYEERIYYHGLIATRSANWHDFFNAMVWKSFPQSKIAINAIHHQEIVQQTDSRRSRKRDLLTLFDECGVVIIANDNILKLIRTHQWQALFVENKELWLTGAIQIITFGHAMFEKYQQPYIGMTAQALLLQGDIVDLDNFIAERILNGTILANKVELSPLPVLGIPEWHEIQDQAFYANTDYFRPARQSDKRASH